MAIHTTRSKDITRDQKYWIPCSECDRPTKHLVVSSFDITRDDQDEGIKYWYEYQIVECQGCNSISFRQNYKHSEDVGYDDEGNEFILDHEEIFPARLAGRKKMRGHYFLPSKIEQIYAETHSVVCNGLRILAGVGIRAIIEVVCQDKAAKGSDLKEKIDDLVQMGVLTKDGADILHHLRIMGNIAAHEVDPQSEQDLDAAFDVIEHLLQGVYLLRIKAKRLKKNGDGRQGLKITPTS